MFASPSDMNQHIQIVLYGTSISSLATLVVVSKCYFLSVRDCWYIVVVIG